MREIILALSVLMVASLARAGQPGEQQKTARHRGPVPLRRSAPRLVLTPDGKQAVYCRQWIDDRVERQALWLG